MNEDEFKDYLEYVLGVTLILGGNIRLKPVYLAWHEFTPEETRIAIQAIKQTTIQEIKHLEDGMQLRLEFNQIPAELEAMLVDLAGDDNPDFDWVQTPLDLDNDQSP